MKKYLDAKHRRDDILIFYALDTLKVCLEIELDCLIKTIVFVIIIW